MSTKLVVGRSVSEETGELPVVVRLDPETFDMSDAGLSCAVLIASLDSDARAPFLGVRSFRRQLATGRPSFSEPLGAKLHHNSSGLYEPDNR